MSFLDFLSKMNSSGGKIKAADSGVGGIDSLKWLKYKHKISTREEKVIKERPVAVLILPSQYSRAKEVSSRSQETIDTCYDSKLPVANSGISDVTNISHILCEINHDLIVHREIWSHWLQEGRSKGYSSLTILTPSDSSDSYFKSDNDLPDNHKNISSSLTASKPTQSEPSQLKPNVSELSTILTMLDSSMHSPHREFERFLLCYDSCIPLMTVEETYETIFSRDASRLDVLHHIKFEQDLRGVDKRQIPFKDYMKLDSPGFVLTRYHASLLLEIKKELGDDLASSVRYCLKPELIYFPTMFGLLNCFSNSQAIDSNQIASSSSSDITIQRIPTIYTHTSSRPGDDSAVEATFSAISQNMMIEFRQSGAMFAQHFPSSPAIYSQWKQFVYGEYNFQNTPIHKYRNENPVNYDLIDKEELVSDSITTSTHGSTLKRKLDDSSEGIGKKRRRNNYRVKIVINSHVLYRQPLSVLLQSIIDSDFIPSTVEGSEASTDALALDIIVVLGGVNEDQAHGPLLLPLDNIADVKATRSYQSTVIRTKRNNYDWTGLHELHLHKSHPLISSDYYLYLLDTCKVSETFWKKAVLKLPKLGEDPYRELVSMTTKPHSSIALFGRGVINNYSDTYQYPIGKNDGLTLEMYEKPLFYSDGFVLHGLPKFGDLVRLAPRSKVGTADWYGTGIPRDLYFYHDIGVTKSILIGNTGDMKNVDKYGGRKINSLGSKAYSKIDKFDSKNKSSVIKILETTTNHHLRNPVIDFPDGRI